MPNWEVYKEAERRGILSPEKQSLYNEAKSRGLVPDTEQLRSIPAEIGSALGAGAVSTAEAIGGTMEMIGIPGGETARKFYGEVGQKESLQRPKYLQEGTVIQHPERLYDPRWWIRMGGENAPAMAAMMAPGGALLKLGRIPSLAGSFMGGFTIEAGSAYNEAKRAMKTEGKLDELEIESIATKEGVTVGTLNGLLEILPFANLLRKSPADMKMLKRVISQAGSEGGTEAVQEVVSIIAEKHGHDADISLLDGVGRITESAIAGFGMGATVGGTVGIKDKIEQSKGLKQMFRDKLARRGATETEVDLMDSESTEFEKKLWLSDESVKEDEIYNRAVAKAETFQELTTEEESIIESRYYEYTDDGTLDGELDATADQLKAMQEVDRERAKVIAEEQGLEFQGGKEDITELVHGTDKETADIIRKEGLKTEGMKRKYPYSVWGPTVIYASRDNSGKTWMSKEGTGRTVTYEAGVPLKIKKDANVYTIKTKADGKKLAEKLGYNEIWEMQRDLMLDPVEMSDSLRQDQKDDIIKARKIEQKIIAAGIDILDIQLYEEGDINSFYADFPQVVIYNKDAVTIQKEAKPTKTEQLQAKITELKKQKQTKASLKDTLKAQKEALTDVKEQRKGLLKQIQITEAFKDDLADISTAYKTKDPAKSPLDIVAQREGFDDVKEFVKMISTLEKGFDTAKADIETTKADMAKVEGKKTTREDLTEIKAELKAFKQGVRVGEITSKRQIKENQKLFTDIVQSSSLSAQDKNKFSKAIKNVNTLAALISEVEKFNERAEKLIVERDRRELKVKITKELDKAKPVKKGTKTVGKFDYGSNKMFNRLAVINRMTRKRATTELLAMEDATAETERIEMRMLSLVAGGAKSSPELQAQVYADLKLMKKFGNEAKSEADFINKLNKQEAVDELLTADYLVKADKATIKTKIGNAYRKGFSNTWSFINSMYGKKIADKLNPESVENDKDIAVFQKTKEMGETVNDIYGVTNTAKLFTEMENDKYELTGENGRTKEISKLDLIDIYNSLKNESTRESYYKAYGQEQIDALMVNVEISPQDVAFADYLQDTLQEYREVLNQRNIEITGRDLGSVENYWPRKSEFNEDFFDDIRLQGETPSAMKQRSAGLVTPISGNAWQKATRHIAQAEHVQHVSREYEKLRRLFNDVDVKSQIEDKYGEDVYRALIDHIDQLSLNAQTKNLDMISSIFGKALNNWVTSKIALNPSTYLRQLGSVTNFAEEMDSKEWVKGFYDGLKSPKETFDFMWKNAPFLEARFNRGYSEALESAIRGAEDVGDKWQKWTSFLTSMTRAGDVTAIVYGGYPLVKAEMAKGKTKEEAFETFRKSTLRSQQSSLKSSLSAFQQSQTPFARLLLAFKNTANQYFRKMSDAVISYQNGDISKTQLMKTLAMYQIVQPIMYASLGALASAPFKLIGGEDEEEMADKLFNDIMMQIAINPTIAVPIVSDMAKFGYKRATGQKAWKMLSAPMLDDLETAGRKLAKKDITAEDFLTGIATLQEPATAFPATTAIRYYNFLKGDK